MKKLKYNMICKKADHNLHPVSNTEWELDGYRNNPITLANYIKEGIKVAVFSTRSNRSYFVGILVGFRYNPIADRYVYRLKKIDQQVEWPENKGYRHEAYTNI
jgi:hypothetical protein